MELLSLEHFDKQKLEDGSYNEKLFYFEETEWDNGNINWELKSFNLSDNVPSYEFANYKDKFPVVKILNK